VTMSAEFAVNLPTALAQLDAYYAANWAVTDWYIDGTVGSDSNNGTTAATPLKTGEELQRRLGSYARWSHSVTIHVLANGMTDALVLRGMLSTTGLHLDVIGTPTVLASDVLSSYLALNHATPRATEIVGTAITDFTPYRWRRVRITSGARAGWICWIATSNPNGVGVATARVSPGIAIDTASTSYPLKTTAPVPSDPFVIERLPIVPELVVDLDGPVDNSQSVNQWNLRHLFIDSLDCPQIMTRTIANRAYCRAFIFGCRCKTIGYDTFTGREYQAPIAAGCSMGVNYSSTSNLIFANVTYSLFGESGTTVSMTAAQMGMQNCLLQGVGINVNVSGGYLVHVQIFDNVRADGAVRLNGECTLFNASGAGNTFGIGIQDGSKLNWLGTVNLTGTTAACTFLTAPVTNISDAAYKQPDDYAQSGTATLVGGTVTVTVPWYDNTKQRVMAIRTSSGGTGDLIVSQISSTQFTITSPTPTDTSTVNWMISPLGRGIYVTKN
jgi:hypothetical protein